MHELRAPALHRLQIESREQRELLKEHRPLAPRRRLADSIAAVLERDRRLDGRLPRGQIVAAQYTPIAATRAVHHILALDEADNCLRHEARVERVAGSVDLTLAVRSPLLCLGHEPPVGPCEGAVSKQLAGPRHVAAGNVERRRVLPLLTKQAEDALNRRADPWHDRIPLLRVTDRVLTDLGEAQRSELPQQEHPRPESTRDAGGEQTRPRHKV